MADQQWSDLRTPGDIMAVQATAGAGETTDVAVLTFPGELWWRRSRSGHPDGWVWEQSGFPPVAVPSPQSVATTVAPLAPDVDGAPIGALGGSEINVWVHRSAAVDVPWTELPGPQNNGAILRPLRLPAAGGETRSALLASDGVPWLVTLQNGAGAFEPSLDPAPDLPGNWSMTGPAAYAVGSPTPGAPPRAHVVLSVNVHEIWESQIRVGYPAGPNWAWIDPGAIPGDASTDIVDAAGVRLPNGSWEVWALFGGREQDGPSFILRGAGQSWSWAEIGKPDDAVYWPRCITSVGGRPWAAAQTVDDAWFGWTPDDGWSALAGVPSGGYVWPGGAATAGASRPWMVGLTDQRLWTWAPPPADPQAVDHGVPVAVASVAGARIDGATLGHVLDRSGRLWERGTFPMWIPHGAPAPGVRLQTPVGVAQYTVGGQVIDAAFAVGDDAHLWERRADPELSWVDHGGPKAGVVGAVCPPIPVDVSADTMFVEILVVGADGRLWARVVGAAAAWEDRGAPPGRGIFAVVGADQMPRPQGGMMTAAAVIADDGHVWVRAPGVAWVDLGVPRAGDRAIAGIGACLAQLGGQLMLTAVALGSPSGRLASVAWSPAVPLQPWHDLGFPAGVGIDGSLGVEPLPTNDGVHVAVVGRDGAVWSRNANGWTSWGRPGTAPIRQGRLVPIAESPGTAAAVTTADGHLWSLPAPS